MKYTIAEIVKRTGCSPEVLRTLFAYSLVRPDRSGAHWAYSERDLWTVQNYLRIRKELPPMKALKRMGEIQNERNQMDGKIKGRRAMDIAAGQEVSHADEQG